DDLDVEADPHSDTITHEVGSLDPNYDDIAVDAVTVTVDDNDVCGDAYCNPSESSMTCPTDCGSTCGDTVCNGAETPANCPTDCGSDCGDSVANGPEVCDGADLLGETCNSQGYDYGTLACAADCLSLDATNCRDNACGDGVTFGSEACDDGVNN